MRRSRKRYLVAKRLIVLAMAKLLVGFFGGVLAVPYIQLHEVVADDNQTQFTVMCHLGHTDQMSNFCHPMGRYDFIFTREDTGVDQGEPMPEVEPEQNGVDSAPIIEDDGVESNLQGAQVKFVKGGFLDKVAMKKGEIRYLSSRSVAEDLITPGLPIHIPAEDGFETLATKDPSQINALCANAIAGKGGEWCPESINEIKILFPGYKIATTAGRGTITGTHIIGSSKASRLYFDSEAVICHSFSNLNYCHNAAKCK